MISSYNITETYDLELINLKTLEDTLDPSNIKEYLILNNTLVENIPFTILDNSFYFIEDNIKEVDYTDAYKYRPEYLSQEKYGTPSLYFIIMYVNNIATKLDFNGSNLTKIKYPSLDSLIKLQFFIEESEIHGKLTNPIDTLYKF